MTDKKTPTPAPEPRRAPHDCDYVRRYSDEVHLAAGTATEVENESVVGYVAFRHDWMRRHGLRAQMCSLVDVTGDSMEPEMFDKDSVLVDHSRCQGSARNFFSNFDNRPLGVPTR